MVKASNDIIIRRVMEQAKIRCHRIQSLRIKSAPGQFENMRIHSQTLTNSRTFHGPYSNCLPATTLHPATKHAVRLLTRIPYCTLLRPGVTAVFTTAKCETADFVTLNVVIKTAVLADMLTLSDV